MTTPTELPHLVPTDNCDGLPDKPEIAQDVRATLEYQEARTAPGGEELEALLAKLAVLGRDVLPPAE